MDTKKLRQKILDLAIHGKLVPQDTTDEPASALLERIKAEKERLIKEGKIKGTKKSAKASDTPHYQQGVPFEVPENWVWCKLGNCCHIVGRIGFRGYTKDDLVAERQGAITLSPSNIIDGIMNYQKCTYISWDKYEESPEIKVANGDILLVKTGSSYGKCALVTDLPHNATINPQLVVLKHISLNEQYLTMVLQSNYAQRMYNNFVLGTAIPTFTQAVLSNMQIPLPPISEQKRIVAEIERCFAIIYQTENEKSDLQAVIKQTKCKILDLAIHGELVPQDPNDEPASELLKRINPEAEITCDNGHYPQLPKGWTICQLEQVVEILDNFRKPINTNERNARIANKQEKDLFPYYGATGQVGMIDDFIIDGHYLLLGKDGAPFLDKYAVKAYAITGKCWVNNHAHILAPKIDFEYLIYFLNHVDYSKYVNGSTRLKLTQTDMRSIEILLPPLQEQKRIKSFIQNMFIFLDAIMENL